MTSYFTNIIECSECKKDFTFRGLSSCNTFDAYFFTDGSIMGPMYDTQPDLIECPHCELISWIDELNVIDRMQDHNFFTTDDQSLPPYSHRVHYCEAVAKSLWRNPAEEKKIRIKAWQEFNKMKTRCDPLSIHELDSSIKHGYNE